MPTTRIGLLLDRLPELQALSQELRQLTALQSALTEVLPGNLATGAHVALVKAGELVLSTDNSAIAAKLNQIVPRVLASLRQRGFEITGIRLQMQVRVRDNPLPRKQISLSPNARDAIESLSERLQPSPLKGALTRLRRQAKPRS
jgi:hypothetical protein